MDKIFICSPYRGNIEKNVANAKRYCRYVEYDGIPIAPHLYFTQFLNEEYERYKGMLWGKALLAECKEMYVFADEVTEGMIEEIKTAMELGIPIKFYDADVHEINYDALIINKKIGPGYRKILAEAHGDYCGGGCPFAGDCEKIKAEEPVTEAPAEESTPQPVAPRKASFIEKIFGKGGGRRD